MKNYRKSFKVDPVKPVKVSGRVRGQGQRRLTAASPSGIQKRSLMRALEGMQVQHILCLSTVSTLRPVSILVNESHRVQSSGMCWALIHLIHLDSTPVQLFGLVIPYSLNCQSRQIMASQIRKYPSMSDTQEARFEEYTRRFF